MVALYDSILLDLSQDFDRVDHSLLIYKLMSRNVSGFIIIRMVQTWYTICPLLSSGEIVSQHLLLLEMVSVREEVYLRICLMFS